MSENQKPLSSGREHDHQWAALSYVWILFVIPVARYYMSYDGRNVFLRFHIKQGALLAVIEIMAFVLLQVGLLGSLLGTILIIGAAILSLRGFLAAWHGEQIVLPYVGDIAKRLEV